MTKRAGHQRPTFLVARHEEERSHDNRVENKETTGETAYKK
jgi:hypothetical protein